VKNDSKLFEKLIFFSFQSTKFSKSAVNVAIENDELVYNIN
jgi:hypothetical protein